MSAAPVLPRPEDLVVHIGPMRKRHVRSVLRIEAAVYPRPWSLGIYLSELAQRSTRCYLVAKCNGVVVGYGGMLFAVGDAHITTIAVDPEWQRHKVGTRLLVALARAAVARDATNLTLEVRVSNAGAQAMYRAFGFCEAGVRKGYYTESNEDAIVMWARDVHEPDYLARLRDIEASVPGRTVVEAGAW